MYNFISINVKCPVCNKALMDKAHTVDNEASISLKIAIGNRSGNIRLSSIYGSFNYQCDIEIHNNEIANLYCPHCSSLLFSGESCKTCSAPMIYLYLDMGGKVSFCSRSGCKNHSVEFEDLSTALIKLYNDYSFEGKHPEIYIPTEKAPEPVVDENQEIIESGAFLHSFCPHCKKSLIVNDMLFLKVVNGETGNLMLSPYLNVFSSKSTIFLPEDKAVSNILCPYCDHTLMVDNHDCEECGSKIAKIMIVARTKFIDFYICSKKGCRWHGLSKEDLNEIRLEDSLEW